MGLYAASLGGGSEISGVSGDTAFRQEELLTHKVSKTDTIAGLAIKYNTTISEIKAANGLRFDSSMYAREMLTIPLAQGICSSPYKWTHAYQTPLQYDSSPLSLWRYDSDELTEQYRFMRKRSRSTEPGDVELISME